MKLDDLERKTLRNKVSYADLYNIMQDVFTLTQRMGLPEDLENAIITIQRVTAALYALRVAALAAVAPGMGVVGAIGAALGALISAFSAFDSVVGEFERRQRY
jgi:hypothetical protein